MSFAQLSLAQTPPLSVPLRYFLSAPLFLAAAALLVLWQGPAVLAGRWAGASLALVHLFTLGVLAEVMVGAAQQLLPVLLGIQFSRPRLFAAAVHLPLTLGTVALVAGFLGLHAAFAPALVLLGFAFTVFCGVGLWALWRSASVHATRPAMALALGALLITAALGLHLGAGHAWPHYGIDRRLTDLHMLWGLGGWVGLLLVGVAYQVVPMFQITPEYPRRLTRPLAPVLFAVLALTLLTAFVAPAWVGAGEWLAGLVGAVFAVATLRLQQRRKRRLPDATLAFWRLAMGSYLATFALWTAAQWTPWRPPGLLIGGLFVFAVVLPALIGMLYKIAPFLAWLHLNIAVQALGGPQSLVPNVKQYIPQQAARRHLWLHALATVGALAALFWPVLARPVAVVWLVDAGMLGVNLVAVLRLYRRTLLTARQVPA